MRNWKSVALGSACLLAVGCGGAEGETASAELESESMGGERVSAGATDDPYVAYESDTFGSEGEIAAETDTGDVYSGGMTGDIEQEFEEDEMSGELAQGTQQPMGEQPMGQEPMGEQPMGEQPMGEQPMGQEPMAMTAEEVCPADIEGLNVRASTIPRGGALVFTVAREQVQDLRDRLNRFAELHMQQHQGAHGASSGMQHEESMGSATGTPPSGSASVGAGGVGASGSIGAGGASGDIGASGAETGESVEFVDAQALIHQASEVRVVETPRGARLEVRLDEPDRVSDLRAELREDATMLREGRCPLALQIAS